MTAGPPGPAVLFVGRFLISPGGYPQDDVQTERQFGKCPKSSLKTSRKRSGAVLSVSWRLTHNEQAVTVPTSIAGGSGTLQRDAAELVQSAPCHLIRRSGLQLTQASWAAFRRTFSLLRDAK